MSITLSEVAAPIDAQPAVIAGNIYDYPKYYDLVFGSDWKAEFDFLRDCFENHAARRIESVFEPACGTGRLLIKLAKQGCTVAGNDLNPQAIGYCNARLKRHGLEPSAVVGDMTDFTVSEPVDAAFNMINSFRHLPCEELARAHLRCVAEALAPGGLYVLGMHLIPTEGEPIESESWSATRGQLTVNSHMWSQGIDLAARNERLGMTFDVYTPTRSFRIADEMNYRTYTKAQMLDLLSHTPELRIIDTYDFCYDIDHPVDIDATTEDVVFVLRKRVVG